MHKFDLFTPLEGTSSPLISRVLVVSVEAAQSVKALVEAYEGVAFVVGQQDGSLTLCAPSDREIELDEIVNVIHEMIRTRPQSK